MKGAGGLDGEAAIENIIQNLSIEGSDRTSVRVSDFRQAELLHGFFQHGNPGLFQVLKSPLTIIGPDFRQSNATIDSIPAETIGLAQS